MLFIKLSGRVLAIAFGCLMVSDITTTLAVFGSIFTIILLATCLFTFLISIEALLDFYGIGWPYGEMESESSRRSLPGPKASKGSPNVY